REILEFETIKKETDEYYKGDVVTKQEGVNGIQIFEGTITKVGGEVTDRQTDSIEKVRKKKNKILLIGTAERPKTAPTGTFAIPLDYYTITSNFGYRWGRLHAGVDLGDPTGTPIYASDGGTVIRSGWYGGYGQCIDIDHGNGRMTRYGHCSALLVSAGEQVYQGQYIGRVGNTGNSFGSHLHFEIHLNGRAVDPRPILGI
ncbi:MAG: peptidoglycan DD-metalloendopeptidase family protein, partial [Lachnospiraceae bacterium]|nr:peptidoglycan DD-metalloendopeptidase family protein [Lachnospiraceae bacterium]